MLDEEEIVNQQELLNNYRRNLHYLLRQTAKYGGEAYAPLQVMNDIWEQRVAIRGIKDTLRGAGVQVADVPGDSPYSDDQEPANLDQGEAARNHVDWGEATGVTSFYGRAAELTELKRWIAVNHCRVVAIWGMGGIGKTSLAIKLATQVRDRFSYLFWRDLRNAPLLENILADCIKFLSHQQQVDLPEDLDSRISLLMHYLREQRCLLVLDNAETILQGDTRNGHYREGYEGYVRLLERVGKSDHQSCLLLTTREKPRQFTRLEEKKGVVRSYQLSGLNEAEGRKIFEDQDMSGTEAQYTKLIGLYGGNPLALKLVSATVNDWYGGEIQSFLRGNTMVFGDIREILDQQLARLSSMERDIMYWLTIERDWVSLVELEQEMKYWLVSDVPGFSPTDRPEYTLRPILQRELIETLDSLLNKSLIEKQSVQFRLQPVVMEYLTEQLVAQVCQEITNKITNVLRSHSLMKAQAHEHIRQSQARLILQPIIGRLLTTSRKTDVEDMLRSIVAEAQFHSQRSQDYTGGNALNLLIQMGSDLRGWNFSHLAIWQAFLQGVSLHDVNFAHADLTRSVFNDTLRTIYSVAYSPNGKMLAAGIDDGNIHIWHAATGQALLVCTGHTKRVRAVAFSPDSTKLASASLDQTMHIWDAVTGDCLKIFKGHADLVGSVAFSADGRLLASGGEDRTVRVWDANTGDCLQILQGHISGVRVVTFSPDGRTLVSGSSDRTIRVWNLDTWQCSDILQEHIGEVWSIAFSPDGRLMASGGPDCTVRLWSTNTWDCLRTLHAHTNWILSVALSPDAHTVASGSSDQTIRLWDTTTGQCLKTLQGHTNLVWSVTFSPDGRTLASGSEDQTVRLWDISAGQSLKTLQGYVNPIRSVAFSPDGRMLASGSGDSTVRLWTVDTGTCTHTLQGHTGVVRSVAFNPDGRILASGGEDRTVRLWDVASGLCLRTLQQHTNWVMAVAFCPVTDTLVSASSDQTLRLWDASTGQLLQTLQEDTELIRSVGFSPDGKKLAVGTGGDPTVRVWDISTAMRSQTLQGHTGWVVALAYSPTGDLLVTGSNDRTLRVWDARTSQCLKILEEDTGAVRSIAFSPTAGILASGNGDRTVRLWKVGIWQCILTLRGHADDVKSIAFSPDGHLLASGGDDETIMIWDVHTGTCLRVLRSDRPYERMNITGATGLTEVQRTALRLLGAIER